VSVVFTCEWTRQRVVFLDVAAYEESAYWRHTRTRYERSSRLQACVICASEEYQLHHLHYRNVGYENLADLMPLCGDHHYEVEKHVRAAKADLDREAATYDYIERLESRAEGERIRGPRRLDPLSSLGIEKPREIESAA
jgi:hypothetical protein